jgi:RimJ/RimL family protein N-acetyltransferase
MKDLMLRHAFRFVDRVVFLIGPQNLRSRRAVEKLGATQIANRLDANGREVVAYQLSRQTFKDL